MASGKGRDYLKSNGNSGLDFLLARQQDDGSVWYSKDSDQTRVWVTADAAIAISGETLPISQPPLEEKDDDTNPATTSGGATVPSSSSSTPNLYDDTSSSTGGSQSSSGSGSSGNGGSGNGGSSASVGETPDPVTSDTDVPPLGADIPVVPVAPTEAVLAASRQGDEPSALIAILIFMVVSGGLAGGTVLLARRMKW
jgi:hypothetical protein